MNKDYSKLGENKSIYFASDFHLGSSTHAKSVEFEKKIVAWLDSISDSVQAIFLVGDVFDFWFEYKHVVPKGYVRFLGKLAELSDCGVKIIFFSGNHDLWLKGYLQEEIGVTIYHEPQSFQIGNRTFYIGHGDGLGPGDRKFKFFKKFFKNTICQWLFGWIHPTIAFSIARFWSSASSNSQAREELVFQGDKEWLVVHSEEVESTTSHDYYIFGHRHIATEYVLSSGATYMNLGEWWMSNPTYAQFDGEKLILKSIPDENR